MDHVKKELQQKKYTKIPNLLLDTGKAHTEFLTRTYFDNNFHFHGIIPRKDNLYKEKTHTDILIVIYILDTHTQTLHFIFIDLFTESESHIEFLTNCLELNIVPKSFKVNQNIPVNKEVSFILIDQVKQGDRVRLAKM